MVTALSLIGFYLIREFWPWMLFRFLFGGSLGLFYRGVEYWINGTSQNSVRGRNIGIYNVCFMLGIAVGSGMQPMFGIIGSLPYLIVLGIIACAILLILTQKFEVLPDMGKISNVFSRVIIFATPIALLGVFAYALFEDIPAYLMSVYALRNGLGVEIAAYTLTAVAVGDLIFAVPIGLISDRMNRVTLLIICAACVIILSSIIPFILHDPTAFLITLGIWGGFAGAVYCVALAIIGDRFKGRDLAIANANFGMVYAFGGLLGPLLNGFAIDTLDSHGMLLSAGLIYGVFILLSLSIHLVKASRQAL